MLHSIQKLALSLLLLSVIGFTACNDDDSTGPNNDLNVLETIETESDLSMLNDFLSEESWSDTLSQDDHPVTVFAPTDDALEDAEADTLSNEALTDLLQYHVVEENLTHEDLKNTDSATALNEGTLTFSTDGDTVTVNEDQVMITDDGIEATNGTVFVIDTVLTQPEE